MIAHVRAPARRSALLLHAMSNADREWILVRLPEEQRKALRGLLSELSSLGIPADRKLLEPFSIQGGAATDASTQQDQMTRSADILTMLNRADPGRIAVVLQNEPAPLIAAVVRAAEWSWRDFVLQQLGPAKRKQVLDLLAPQLGAFTACSTDSAVLGLVMRSIAERLDPPATDGLAAGTAPPRRPKVWQWLAGRGARLLGLDGGHSRGGVGR